MIKSFQLKLYIIMINNSYIFTVGLSMHKMNA